MRDRKIKHWLISFILLPLSLHAFSPYSNPELDELEKSFVEQINHAGNVIHTPLINEYINQLGSRLAKQANMDAPHFFVVKSNEINAFAGPGGYIGVNTQLILASDNESELAGVMAHEMAHVRQHHLYRMIEHQKLMRTPKLAGMLAAIALGVIDPSLASGAMMATMSGFAQNDINMVRSHEKEADRIGIGMLIRSDIDPRGMASFFKKMQQQSRYSYSDNMPAILRTHPLDADRIAEAESRTQTITAPLKPFVPDYTLIKEMIRNETAENQSQLLHYYQKNCGTKINDIACSFGKTLVFIQLNQWRTAEEHLLPLWNTEKNNLYYSTTLANIYLAEQKNDEALTLLADNYQNFPAHYPVLNAYAQGLIAAGQPLKATYVLLKGRRLYPMDLSLCITLARAQAEAKQLGWAYFTNAQCEYLQGEFKNALRQLKMAESLAKSDHLLRARIQAKREEMTP